MAEKKVVSAAEVRAWALKKGLQVGTRGHLSQAVIDAFNRAHRTKVFINKNPMLRAAS